MPRILIGFAVFIISILSSPISAQPRTRMTYCLNAVYEVQTFYFSSANKYLGNEKSLKRQLPEPCREFNYWIHVKPDHGFRVTVGTKEEEFWTVDEKYSMVRLAGAKKDSTGRDTPAADNSKALSEPRQAPPNLPPPPSKGVTSIQALSAPMAPTPPVVIAAPSTGPPAGSNAESTSIAPLVNPLVEAMKPDADARLRLTQCMQKRLYPTPNCQRMFQDLEKSCEVQSDQVPVICAEYRRLVDGAILSSCPLTTESWGQCDLKLAKIKKKCKNPFRQFSSDCRDLNKFLSQVDMATAATTAPPAASDAAPQLAEGEGPPSAGSDDPPPRTPASWANSRGPSTLDSIRNVRTLALALRTLLKLRAVTYQSKNTKEENVGFVAEEVAAVDPSYVEFDEKHNLQGINPAALTALITGAVQELYGSCQKDSDLQKDLIRRLGVLEQENAQLRATVEQQRKDLFKIKERLNMD
ncbi:MAG: tail fiber domain-containing protein [Bdellovibrionales bacterium]